MKYLFLVHESAVSLDLLLILVFSEIVDSIQAIRPDRVSHQIYLEACDSYTYPSRPQVSFFIHTGLVTSWFFDNTMSQRRYLDLYATRLNLT